MLYWSDDLKFFILHFMPERSDHMEGENVKFYYFVDRYLIYGLEILRGIIDADGL